MDALTEPEYLTIREAAALLRCCPDTVRAGIRRREIPAVRVGRVIRIPRVGLAVPTAPEPELEAAA
jgi:excisionase family DNA binding protein